MQAEPPWEALPRQRVAYVSEANELFYGGAAGGGKSDLLLGVALFEHQRAIIFRRQYVQLTGLQDRAHEIYTLFGKFNGKKNRWGKFRDPGKFIEFGACQLELDKENYQGRAHDFKGFDEITQFTESQYRFLIQWTRTARPQQRTRIICTGNPPMSVEGEWVIKYWAPWLDEEHPDYPAKPGELRWFTSVKGVDKEVESGEPQLINDEWVTPKSRTFIPARVEDNPYLIRKGYKSQLQAAEEPMRSKLLYGDFTAGRADDPFQVIPTEWIRGAQQRWITRMGALNEEGNELGQMTDMGVDVARGGIDRTVLTLRYGDIATKQLVFKGSQTPDSNTVVGVIQANTKDSPVYKVDVIGVGAAVVDQLLNQDKQVISMNSSHKSRRKDIHNQLTFANKRAEWWWNLRDLFDPKSDDPIAIPDDAELRRELSTPHWKEVVKGIQIESKDDIRKRTGKSTDKADSLVYAFAKEMVMQVYTGNVTFMRR